VNPSDKSSGARSIGPWYLRTFAFSIGKRYQDLVPDEDLVIPSKTHTTKGYEGWAYAARTADKTIFLA
jgi:hypothetical protein